MRYFTSDQHFYHTNVIKYCNRPYNSVEEMNEALINNWNSVVKPDDEVIVVGDFSMAFRPVEIFTNRLMGRKTLVAGNHDFCHPYHKKSRKPENLELWTQKYLENGWEKVCLKMEINLPGIGMTNIAHLPYKFYEDSHKEDKYENYRIENDGRWLICGHVHGAWKIRENQLNVGVDVWDMKPVSEQQVITNILTAVQGK